MRFTVGLTGGIGSGKSTVADLFAKRGAGIVDADEISHRLTGPGQAAVARIAEHFGPEFAAVDGSLDRRRMRELVFENASARAELEGILHPLIREESLKQVRESPAPYTLLVVPLLVESGAMRKHMARVLVVDCDPEIQVGRVMRRSGLPREQVLAIIGAQATRDRRLAAADDVIRNDAGVEALVPQVDALHARYLEQAKAAG